MEKNYDCLSKILEVSPQTCVSPENEGHYERVCGLCDAGAYKDAVDFMSQWDYGEDTEDTDGMDSYEYVLYEDECYILAVCPSCHFGWQGDAFILYRKDKEG